MDALGDQLVPLQSGAGADHHAPGEGIHVDDIRTLGRPADLQSSPLPDGEVIVAVVPSDDVPLDVDNLAGIGARSDSGLALDDARVAVLLRNEADLVRFLLSRHRQSRLLGDRPHLRLGQLAEREHRIAELILRKLEEKIGLILGPILCLAQLEHAAAVRCDPRVVPGGDSLRADGLSLLMKEIELDVRVAEHARTGRHAAQIGLHERRDDLLMKILLEVQREMRNLELPRHAPRVRQIVDGAAPAVRRVGVRQVVVHLHRQSDDVMSAGLENVRGGRRVDPARHGDRDLHGGFLSIAGARDIPQGIEHACVVGDWSRKSVAGKNASSAFSSSMTTRVSGD